MAKYFSDKEFRNCTPSCSILQMDQDFLGKLDIAREKAGIPFVINCGYRTKAWDIAKGRSGNSAHTEVPCTAVDIRCNTSTNRIRVVKALLEAGFTRIGIGKDFIHVDCSTKLPQGVMFHYY